MTKKRTKQGSRESTTREPETKEQLGARWDAVALHARQIDWGWTSIAALAAKAGLEWFVSRGNEPLSSFLDYDGSGIFEVPGFGRGKVRRLCEIVEQSLDGVNDGLAMPEFADPFKTLEAWGVPDDLPIQLMMLPVRVTKHCEATGLDTIAQLLEEWESIGFEGFIVQKNLGKKSITRLESFMESLANMDRETAKEVLPLHPDEQGLSLGSSLKLVISKLSETDRSLLTRRFVKRMTLQESAEEKGVSRERVRQIERDVLAELRVRFDYFDEERATLLAEWDAGKDWFAPLQHGKLEPDDHFLKAAIEALFRDSPQAITSAQEADARLTAWHDELLRDPKLWIGGVPLADFLNAQVPPEDHETLCDFIADSSYLRIDYMEKKVHPGRTGLAETVVALIATQSAPISLSSLVRLLNRTDYHRGVTRDLLLRRQRDWIRRYKLPNTKVIWEK